MARQVPSRVRATSASWPTSMPGRRPRPSVSFSTPASTTRSARSTTVPRRWTGWCRSRSEASPSRRPRRPVCGGAIASTSSTRPATWISRSRSSGACACSTARSGYSARVGGVQPQSETVWRQADKYRVPRIAFVNKMDRVGADFDRVVQQIQERLKARRRSCSSCRLATRTTSAASSTWSAKGAVWDDESLGAKYHVEDVPAAMCRRRRAREKLVEAVAEIDETLLEKYLESRRAQRGRDPRARSARRRWR